MLDMNKINDLQGWFFQTLKGASKPYWILSRANGQGKVKLAWNTPGELTLDDEWEILLKYITSQYNNNIRKFYILTAAGGKQDPNKSEWTLDLNGVNTSQTAGIAGPNGHVDQSQIAAPYIAKIEQKDSQIQLLRDEIKDMKHKAEIQSVKDELMGEIERSKGGFDRFLDRCEAMFDVMPESVQNRIVAGVFGKFGVNIPAGMAGIGNTSTIKEQTANNGATVPPHNEALPEPSEEDMEFARQILANLLALGIDEPGKRLAILFGQNGQMIIPFLQNVQLQ